MTETLVVFATAFAGFLLSDPFFGGVLTKHAVAKWPLLALVFGSLAFHLVGRALTDPQRLRRVAGEVARTWWPLLLLATIITLGSAYARWVEDIRESFLGMGLGMFFLPLLALAVRSSRHPMGFMQGLAAVYALTVAGMLAILLSGSHVFHEEIFVAAPLGAYFLCARPLRAWSALLGLALIGICLVSFKNTTFLIVLAVLTGCGLIAVRRLLLRENRMAVVAALYVGTPLVLAAGTTLAWLWWTRRSDLPSGNVEYRTEMYGIAWRRFLDSPIWGSGFTDSSVTYFELFRVATRVQYLPTHSDILDLLAHGGVIALALWLLTVWRLARIGAAAWQRLSVIEPGDPARAWRWLFVLALCQLGAIVTYAVNPPLINPVHAFWVWGAGGVMWALHRSLIDPLPQPLRVVHQIPRHPPRAPLLEWRPLWQALAGRARGLARRLARRRDPTARA